MNLKEKIDWLNKECDYTLSITYYSSWSINSYGKNTPLNNDLYLASEDLEELVDKAVELVKKNQNKLVINGKTYKLVEENL